MLQPLFDYLRSITGSTFPTGLLVVYGLGLLLYGEMERGARVLAAAVGWYYLASGVQIYRSIGAAAGTMTPLKYGVLGGLWVGVCWLLG